MKESMSITVPKGYSGTLGRHIAHNLRLDIVEFAASSEDIEFAASSEDEEFATSSDEEAAPHTIQNANKSLKNN